MSIIYIDFSSGFGIFGTLEVVVAIPQEVLDLRIDRRGRPRSCKPCVLCGDKGYAAPVIEGEKVPLCRKHYNRWYKRKQRAKEKRGEYYQEDTV